MRIEAWWHCFHTWTTGSSFRFRKHGHLKIHDVSVLNHVVYDIDTPNQITIGYFKVGGKSISCPCIVALDFTLFFHSWDFWNFFFPLQYRISKHVYFDGELLTRETLRLRNVTHNLADFPCKPQMLLVSWHKSFSKLWFICSNCSYINCLCRKPWLQVFWLMLHESWWCI